MVGENAFKVEQGILKWLLEKKILPPYLSPEQMPRGGASETVDAIEIDLKTIWAKVQEMAKVMN